MLRRPLLLGAVALLGACTASEPTATTTIRDAAFSAGSALPPAGDRGVTVMTRNLYLGGDIFGVATGTGPVPLRVANFWQEVLASNYPERAGAIAREIAATSPHLVGLQEVPIYRIDPLGDAAVGGTNPATLVQLDFLAILMDSLAALGLEYDAVAVQEASDLEFPMIVSPPPNLRFVDLRYTDRDVILARSDVPTSDPRGAKFTYALTVPVPVDEHTTLMVSVPRAWTSVQAFVAGNTFRFVNTHLETQIAPPIQVAQARELLAIVAGETSPVILVGDINSAADRSQTASYGLLIDQGGFVDAWNEAHGDDPGHTSSLSLTGPDDLKQRIDVILMRQNFRAAAAVGIVGGVHADIVGEEEGDRTASGLRPSDHAGVVATFRLPPARAGSR